MNSLTPDQAIVAMDAFAQFVAQHADMHGLAEEEIRSSIYQQLFTDSLRTWCAKERAQEEARANTPAGRALARALECHRATEELRLTGATPDGTSFREACLEYLWVAHGVRPGDTVVVEGWSEPRTIIVDEFSLTFFQIEGRPADGMMFFEGECIHGLARKPYTRVHGTLIGSKVSKL